MKEALAAMLDKDEQIVLESRPSLSGLVICWIAIPGLYMVSNLLAFLAALPGIIRAMVSSAMRNTIMEFLDLPSLSFGDIVDYSIGSLFDGIPNFIKMLLGISVTILVVAWILVCLTITYRYFRYSLVITDLRVIGIAEGKTFSESLEEVTNVYLEQPFLGKLLHYGNIVVKTQHRTMTFKNLSHPQAIKDLLMRYAEASIG